MGRSYTPKYRVEYRDNTCFVDGRVPTIFPQRVSWPKELGKPTDKSAEELRCNMNQSFKPGDVNEHVSDSLGVVVHIYKLWVVEQKTGQWVAEANAPMFEIV